MARRAPTSAAAVALASAVLVVLAGVALVTLASAAAVAAPAEADAGAAAPAEAAAAAPDQPTAVEPRSRWVFVLPVVSYAPETELAIGATAGRSYRFSDDPQRRPSLVVPLLLATTRGHLVVRLFADAWWDDDRWNLAGNVGAAREPMLFYGLGDDTPAAAEEEVTRAAARLDVTIARALAPGIYVGPRLEWEDGRVVEREPGGLIAAGDVPGAGGADLFGLGLVATYDTRDATLYPTTGWLATVGVSRFAAALGGDFAYTRGIVDVRRYVGLGGARVLALQAAGTSLGRGRAPFTQLARLGLRGYRDTRWLEDHGALAQVELRAPVRGRLGAAAFAGVSELAAGFDRLRLDEARAAWGLGLRVRLGDDGPQRANLRFDLGFGEGGREFYVSFAEAY